MARAKISRSSGMGQKLDTLYYDVEQVVGEHTDQGEEGSDRRKVVNRKVSIDLFMTKKFNTMQDRPPPAETLDLAFTLHCAELDVTVHGFDVSVMLKDMRSQLDRRFKISWVDYFVVRILPQSVYDGLGTAMSFSYETVQRGVALDGSVLMRRYNRHGSGLHSSHWIIEPWPKDVRENGRLVATIIATPENERKLESFREKIDMLRKALAAMVSPDRLEQTLLMAAHDDFLLLDHDG